MSESVRFNPKLTLREQLSAVQKENDDLWRVVNDLRRRFDKHISLAASRAELEYLAHHGKLPPAVVAGISPPHSSRG